MQEQILFLIPYEKESPKIAEQFQFSNLFTPFLNAVRHVSNLVCLGARNHLCWIKNIVQHTTAI